MEEHRIGIPPQLMKRDKGERIQIEHWGEELLVFNKPQAIAAKSDPWFSQKPDLESAFGQQLQNQKPELIHHGFEELRVFNQLECEATGAVLASIKQNEGARWKNEFGSYRFEFHTILITRKSNLTKPFKCDLPLTRHFKNERMMVSHNLGKKTVSHFTPICEGRNADAWLGSTRYPRLHQYRVQGREKGLPLLRDPLYDPTYPKDLLEEDFFKLDWVHNYAIKAAQELGLEKDHVTVAPPKYWKRNLRKAGLEIDEILEKTDQIIENITLPIE